MPQPRDPYLRQRVLDLRANNKSADWIADNLNIPKRTVYEWCRNRRDEARHEMAQVLDSLEKLASSERDHRIMDVYTSLKRAVEGLTV